MHVLPSSVAIWVCITSRAAWDRHLSCHTAHLKGCCIFHTFLQGKLFSCASYMYLTADTKYRMLLWHPIWPFWKHLFSFFKEHNRSLIVKPRIRNSSGDVPQATLGLAKGMSLGCSTAAFHFLSSKRKSKSRIHKCLLPSSRRSFFSCIPSLLHNHCSFAFRVCFGGYFV